MAYKLIYFKGPGRAEQVRLLMALTGAQWEDEFVDMEKMKVAKAEGRFPFGQVPVLVTPDGHMIAQSAAMRAYLAEVTGTHGSTPLERAECEMVAQGVDDVRNLGYKAYFAPPAEKEAKLKTIKETDFPLWLGYFETLLKKNKDGPKRFVGTKTRYCDICVLDMLLSLEKTYLFPLDAAHFPLLVAFRDDMMAIPQLKAYHASDRALPRVPY